MGIVAYETYSSLTGKQHDFEDFLALLKQFRRQSVLWHCAALNFGARIWESNWATAPNALELVHKAMRIYFSPAIAAQLILRSWYVDARPVFHRRQLLLLEKLAILHCTEDGKDLDEAPHNFGLLLLATNDHLHNRDVAWPTVLSGPLDYAMMIQDFTSVVEVANENLGSTIKRHLTLLGPLTGKRENDKLFYDPLSNFENTTGIDRATFRAFLMGVQGYLNHLSSQKVWTSKGELYLNNQRLSMTKLSGRDLSKLFELLSAEPNAIAADIRQNDTGIGDTTALRKAPLSRRWMNVGTSEQWCGYLVLDPLYLWDKLLNEPYWMLSSVLDKKEGDRFRSFWGQLFEDYCNQLLTEATVGSDSVYLKDVRFENRQLCDGLLLEGNKLTIFEFKGFMLPAKAKYGKDPQRLLTILERNLGRGEEGKSKGVEQLIDAIDILFGHERAIENVVPQWREITEVYPCVVTLDEVGGVVGMSPFLELYATEIHIPVHRTPVFCIPISELERKAPYISTTGLANVLQAWKRVNPSLGTPLSQIELKLRGFRELDILDIRTVLEEDLQNLF